MKRLIDKTFAVAGLVLLSPVLVGAAIAIKLESNGPILFKQSRHGKGNKVFEIWKFRTMRVMETGRDFVQAKEEDPRVTRVGQFLRRTSIDELPQLINVLKGEMSLVGPRPHPTALNDQFAAAIQDYWNRHAVTPGLT
ncbi:MAG: sugar transferase, partial [Rhizobiaceae bacterium]|nr:sugar transferase [Rhizobiaceae bacterium]